MLTEILNGLCISLSATDQERQRLIREYTVLKGHQNLTLPSYHAVVYMYKMFVKLCSWLMYELLHNTISSSSSSSIIHSDPSFLLMPLMSLIPEVQEEYSNYFLNIPCKLAIFISDVIGKPSLKVQCLSEWDMSH